MVACFSADFVPLLEDHQHGFAFLLRCRALFFRVHAVRSGVQEEGVEGGGAYLVDRLHTSLYLVSDLVLVRCSV